MGEIASEDTRRILAGWKAGSAEAGDRIVERYTPELARRARRLLSRRATGLDHEDVLHAAWVRAFSKGALERFEPERPGALAAWLQRILDRAFLDELRHRRALKRGASAPSAFVDEVAGGPHSSPLSMQDADPSPTSRARHAELVTFCQRVLSQREWELWRRVEIEGQAVVDASRELRVSASAARSLLHRSRAKLLRALRP